MSSPFKDVPLNTKRVYVMGVARCGCEVYMPVDSISDSEIGAKKDKLQSYLDGQDIELPPITA